MQEMLNLPNGQKLHVTNHVATLLDKNSKPIKAWKNGELDCEPGSKEFKEKVLTRASIWLAKELIQPDRTGWHVEDYETLWPIMDDDGQAVPCPEELLKTEDMAQRTLQALLGQPKTLNLLIAQPTVQGERKYYKLTIVVTDPKKNETLPELHDNMQDAVRDTFPDLDQDNWPVLVKYVPIDISDKYGFRVTNDPEMRQITTAPRKDN